MVRLKTEEELGEGLDPPWLLEGNSYVCNHCDNEKSYKSCDLLKARADRVCRSAAKLPKDIRHSIYGMYLIERRDVLVHASLDQRCGYGISCWPMYQKLRALMLEYYKTYDDSFLDRHYERHGYGYPWYRETVIPHTKTDLL